MLRAIVHVDMDAFYASVEQRDNPDLRGKPLIVGGHPTRGVVLAASYEARPFGVRSAMPMSQAVKRAPSAIVVPPRFSAYAETSDKIFAIFHSVTPLVEPLSLDEAFLDVTGSTRLLGSPWEITANLRQKIARELSLPCSAGVSPVKFIAKIASDLAKPNGQREVSGDEIKDFLAALPLAKLWGVGPRTEMLLRQLGLRTIGDIAKSQVEWLERRLGSHGRHLWLLSQGVDDRPVVPDREAKSIGAEDTFEEDLRDRERLEIHIHSQSVRVARRLRAAQKKARGIQLKIKYSDFRVVTRSEKFPEATDDGQTIYRRALELFERVDLEKAIRLTGVSTHDFYDQAGQLPLFSQPTKDREKLNAAIDRIAQRFGNQALTTADLAAEDNPDEADRLRAHASRLGKVDS